MLFLFVPLFLLYFTIWLLFVLTQHCWASEAFNHVSDISNLFCFCPKKVPTLGRIFEIYNLQFACVEQLVKLSIMFPIFSPTAIHSQHLLSTTILLHFAQFLLLFSSLLPSACFLHLFDQHLSVNVSCVISLWVFIISIDFYALKYFEANFVVFSHYWYFFQYFQAGIHSCRWLSTTILHQSKQWICKRNRNKTFWKGKCVTNNEFANTNWLIEKRKNSGMYLSTKQIPQPSNKEPVTPRWHSQHSRGLWWVELGLGLVEHSLTQLTFWGGFREMLWQLKMKD